jgi:hypothetical protein
VYRELDRPDALLRLARDTPDEDAFKSWISDAW